MYRDAKKFWETQPKMEQLGASPCPPESIKILKQTVECDDDQTIPYVFVVMGASVSNC